MSNTAISSRPQSPVSSLASCVAALLVAILCFAALPGCGEGAGDDSCRYARDGFCDEPDFCAPGTDVTDCGDARSGDGDSDSGSSYGSSSDDDDTRECENACSAAFYDCSNRCYESGSSCISAAGGFGGGCLGVAESCFDTCHAEDDACRASC